MNPKKIRKIIKTLEMIRDCASTDKQDTKEVLRFRLHSIKERALRLIEIAMTLEAAINQNAGPATVTTASLESPVQTIIGIPKCYLKKTPNHDQSKNH